jgi:hypothetical protein
MIAIDKLTVAANAPHGTLVGHLMAWNNGVRASAPPFVLDADMAPFFAVTSKQAIMTAWTSQPPAGTYAVHVTLGTEVNAEDAWFEIIVTPAAAPAKTLVLSVIPESIPSLPDNTPAGAVLAQMSVQYSDGSPFSGTITSSMPSLLAVDGMQLVTARALAPGDDGPKNVVITATDGQGLTATVRVL